MPAGPMGSRAVFLPCVERVGKELAHPTSLRHLFRDKKRDAEASLSSFTE
jgi:hypothetical protein